MTYCGPAKAADRFFSVGCGCIVIVPSFAEMKDGAVMQSQWAHRCTRDNRPNEHDMLPRVWETQIADFFVGSTYRYEGTGVPWQ